MFLESVRENKFSFSGNKISIFEILGSQIRKVHHIFQKHQNETHLSSLDLFEGEVYQEGFFLDVKQERLRGDFS